MSGNNIGDRNGLLPKEFRIFISYAREDEDKAKRLYNDIKNSGLPIKPWMDKEDIFPGQDFDLEIKKAIKRSNFFIPLFSSISVEKRGYIQREFRLAVDTLQEIPPGDIFVIPVILDKCEIPYDALKRYTYQELFPSSWYAGLDRIVKSIQMSIETKINNYNITLTDNNQNRHLQENITQHLTKQKVSPTLEEEEQEEGQKEKPILQSSLSFIGEKRFFLGRQEYINEKIKDALKKPGSRVSLVGIGGSGKSQLAFKALHQYFEKDKIIDLVIPVYLSAISYLSTTTAAAARNVSTSFDNISQSNASTTLIISITFKRFLNDIGFDLIKKNILPLSEQAFDQLDIENAKSEVNKVLSSKKYPLLYCDNFESLSSMVEDRERDNQEINSIFDFLNNELPSNTSILITSRNRQNFLSEYLIDLEGLKIEEGIDLFIKHASIYQRHLKDKNNIILQDLLKTIVTKTGGHPLSIEILAKTYKGEGSKELEEISQTLGKERKNPVESVERLRSLNNSFKFSIDKLADYNKKLLPALTIFHSAFPSNAIEKIFGLQNKDVLRELYDKSLLSRIEADQYGPISDDRFWLYSLHPALRNYLEDKYKNDIVNIHRERIPFFCKYYKELLKETYDAWGTADHRNFIRRFELMTKSNDNDFDRAIKFAIINSNEDEDNEIKIIGSDIAYYFGLIYQNLGYSDQSLLYLKESLKIHEELKDKAGISVDYLYIGLVYYYKGQLDNALGYYKKALEIHEELEFTAGISANYSSIGLVYNDKGQLDDALGYYKKALEIDDELKDKVGMAKDYTNIGFVYNNKGQLDDALGYYKKALEIDEELKDRVGMAADYNYIGLVYNNKGQLDDALGYYKKALEIHEELKDKVGMSGDYANIGFVYYNKGQLDDALGYHKKALEIHEELKDRVGMAADYAYIGLVYYYKGEIDDVLDYHKKALEIHEELKNNVGMAIDYANIGLVYRKKGQLDDALGYHKKALEIDEELKDRVRMARDYAYIGLVYFNKGQLDDSLGYHKKALEIDDELKDKVGMSGDYTNMGLVYQKKGQLDDALGYHKKALDIDEELENKVGMSGDYTNMGLVYQKKGQLDDALGYHKKALDIDEELKDRVGMAKDYTNIGLVYYYKGQLDDALGYHKKALDIDEELKDIVNLVKDYCNIAEVYLNKNDKEKSKRDIDNAQKIVMEFEQSTKYRHPFANNVEILLNKLNN